MLQIAIKTINDIAGPEGLIFILLIFGAYPRIFSLSPLLLFIAERAKAIYKIIKKIRQLKTKRIINNALATRNSPNIAETIELFIISDIYI